MSKEEAQVQARTWWGDHGAVHVWKGLRHSRYAVGLSPLSSRLGEHVVNEFGHSWDDWEGAFSNAFNNGHGPVTGFEDDDVISDES